jgi:hypothetical protein
MNPKIFEWFEQWFAENNSSINQKTIKLEFSEKKVKDIVHAKWVDIISPIKCGNIIV